MSRDQSPPRWHRAYSLGVGGYCLFFTRRGGQAAADETLLPERSAALVVMGEDIIRGLNLRVDLDEGAITELRRVHAGYVPYVDYYALRANDPANTPP